jgi:hypothetical protein
MNTPFTQFSEEAIPSYICPLFWQHGEDASVLTEEIQKMYENGIHNFIIEARPHPDFLSYGWWRDLDVLIAEAKKREMKVWIFDDSAYPSGYGNGVIKKLYPDSTKRYIGKQHIDAVGPRPGASIQVKSWMRGDDELLKIIATKRADGLEKLDETQMYDITTCMKNGILYWDIPPGTWRIFMIAAIGYGGEEQTNDYVNPLSKTAVRHYIDIIYEEHYKRYSDEFGKTIQGFFVDEPRYGNVESYDFCVGESKLVYPYCDGLLDALSEEFGQDISTFLPFLWSKDNDICKDVHYAYMNVVSKLFGKNFLGQLGDWCRNHKVKVIGHIVEDNGAHARLGFGCGHFFRSLEGFDTSGLDIVYQVWPEYISGYHQTPFGYLNAEFFYWGLSKMASSMAHIDPKKNGNTICEVFGAYGWQEGLKLMKWLTDHICVRGVNILVPHAFSPKFPDNDCPPHFYAHGNNPQWNYFGVWSHYANRVCHLLSNGTHKATCAVVYHAEAEWGGKHDPFEKVAKVLMSNQIDCDIIPIDYLCNTDKTMTVSGKLLINNESYDVLIIPYSANIPKELADTLMALAQNHVPVIFMKDYSEHIYYETNNSTLDALKRQNNIITCTYENLASYLHTNGFFDILAETNSCYLRHIHYNKDGRHIFFFTNESIFETISTNITLPIASKIILYDALQNKFYDAAASYRETSCTLSLELAPYQSIFVLENDFCNGSLSKRIPVSIQGNTLSLEDHWSIKTACPDPNEAKLEGITTLTNLACDELLPTYSGTVHYKTTFELAETTLTGPIYLDLGEVYEISEILVNGTSAGSKICPPHVYDITDYLQTTNELLVKVTNTYAKEKGDNIFDRAMPQEPTGLLGPVRIIY